MFLQILALALLGGGIYCQVEPNPDHFTNGMPNGPAKDKVVDIIKAVENGGVPMMIISGVIVGTTILGKIRSTYKNPDPIFRNEKSTSISDNAKRYLRWWFC